MSKLSYEDKIEIYNERKNYSFILLTIILIIKTFLKR